MQLQRDTSGAVPSSRMPAALELGGLNSGSSSSSLHSCSWRDIQETILTATSLCSVYPTNILNWF
eukprot:2230029-Amphidinium_carterae.1